MENIIRENQNINGGGLAFNITGKYESNRKVLADLDEKKRTAGEAAKELRKLGHKIYAKELKKICEEWHHSGFKPKAKGGGMGRTYYTQKSNEKILEELENLKNEENEKFKSFVSGFYYIWSHDYNGYRGKKRNFKICKWYEGSELSKPKNFTFCSKEDFENSNLYEGQAYYGWDEPRL